MSSFHPLIQSPPRTTSFGAGIIALDIVILSIVFFSRTVELWAALISLLLAALSMRPRDAQALHLTLFTAALITAACLRPPLRSWPYGLLIPISCYCAAVLIFPRLRTSILWMHFGYFSKKTALLVSVIALLSGFALWIWYVLLKPDLTVQLGHMPNMPAWFLPIVGITFAASNAAVEEFVFRGVIMQALDSAAGPGIISVIFQGWLFGAIHYREGFPKGGWGTAMTLVYGLLLGGIRRHSQGMLAPWVAHVIADLVIFAILSVLVL